MIDQNETKKNFSDLFSQFESQLNGQKSSTRHAIRKIAFAEFLKLEFPTGKHEEWKYTNLESLTKSKFKAPSPIKIELPAISNEFMPGAIRIVFVNGFFDKTLSDLSSVPKGTTIKPFSQMNEKEFESISPVFGTKGDVFSAIHGAFLEDGLYVEISDKTAVEAPVQIIFVSESGVLTQPCVFGQIGELAQCTIVEDYISLEQGVHFTNARSEFHIKEAGILHHYRFQNENLSAFHIGHTTLTQEKRSTADTANICFGGAMTRNLTTALLNGEHIESTLNGLYMPTGSQHVDNRTVIHHKKPNCNSHELYKGIMNDKSTAVFNGKIFVHQDAQKTDAKQSNNNLLLSPDATINTKPQLEIFADDVKCTHGATVGRLDEKGMFYLKSRGIRHAEAQNLMTLAFAEEVVTKIKCEPLRNRLDTEIKKRFGLEESINA